jgi:hypothetical protein
MAHHKKSHQCGCEKKQSKQPKQHKKETKQVKEYKKDEEKCGCSCACKCEQKFYFPLPNIPSQPVGGMRVGTDAWFAPGSVQSCCAICSTVQPVYANPCNTCRYPKGTRPINNKAYFTTNEYIY